MNFKASPKRLFFRIAVVLSLLLLTPWLVSAQGFVTCVGRECNLCHLISTGQNLLNWLVAILTVVAVMVLVYAGYRLVSSGGNTEVRDLAKQILINVIVGYIIVLAAWLLVDTGMRMLLNQAIFGPSGSFGPWNRVECRPQPDAGGRLSFDTIDMALDLDVTMATLPPGVDIFSDAIIPPGEEFTEPDPEVPPQPEGEICYPGCGSDGPVCFDAVSLASTGYRYPGGNAPSQFVDMDASHPNMGREIICGYRLPDFNNSAGCGRGGRFVYIDPSAVSRVSTVLNANGRPRVNSAFRSPPCNAQLRQRSRNVAQNSQHMYGIAFDITAPSQQSVIRSCCSAGANHVQIYSGTSHVHCDWRGGGRTNTANQLCR